MKANNTITTQTTLEISSPEFKHEGFIPMKFTCEGQNINPTLLIGKIPTETISLALIMDDPDAPDPAAPKMTYVHWVLYNIPAKVTGLPEGASRSSLPPETRLGLNDWKRSNYGGPCPPIGEHRYYFKLYALDTIFSPQTPTLTKAGLERAMAGHILGQATLMGKYKKTKKQ